MHTRVLADRIAEESPCPSARITGLVYLLYFLTARFSFVLMSENVQIKRRHGFHLRASAPQC